MEEKINLNTEGSKNDNLNQNNLEFQSQEENKIKKVKQSKISKEKRNTILWLIIIIFALLDIILMFNLMNINDKNEEKSVNEQINDNYNGQFEFKGYKIEIPAEYIVNVEQDLCTVEKDNLKSVITINEGTMENIQNNLTLLEAPINEQGGVITLQPELQTINNKDLYVIEYQLDGKDYVIGYTELDENNIVDIITEKSQSNSALQLLVKISNNSTKLED